MCDMLDDNRHRIHLIYFHEVMTPELIECVCGCSSQKEAQKNERKNVFKIQSVFDGATVSYLWNRKCILFYLVFYAFVHRSLHSICITNISEYQNKVLIALQMWSVYDLLITVVNTHRKKMKKFSFWQKTDFFRFPGCVNSTDDGSVKFNIIDAIQL